MYKIIYTESQIENLPEFLNYNSSEEHEVGYLISQELTDSQYIKVLNLVKAGDLFDILPPGDNPLKDR